jgi:GxxExxY protein
MWADLWSERVIGAAIAVHRTLGPGLLESVYEVCLAQELSEQRIPFETQKAIPIRYRGLVLDAGIRLDLLVAGELVVELKSVDRLLDVHSAQLLTYLKLGNYPLGLLINFNVPLLKNGIRRIVHHAPE